MGTNAFFLGKYVSRMSIAELDQSSLVNVRMTKLAWKIFSIKILVSRNGLNYIRSSDGRNKVLENANLLRIGEMLRAIFGSEF